MNEEIEFIIDSAKEQMQGAIDFLIKELRSIRAGKASPSMLANVMVDYYGSQTPLGQVANINTPDARTISIQPWEKQMLTEIEKAIMKANIGFNPMNNGENIIINVPPFVTLYGNDPVTFGVATIYSRHKFKLTLDSYQYYAPSNNHKK